MIRLNDGKTYLWQWDVDQYLEIDGDVRQVHFKLDSQTALGVDVREGRVRIPDELLQKPGHILSFAYDGEATLIAFPFGVHPRPKPPGYVFTETDRKSWEELDERIHNLEETVQKKPTFSINENGHLIYRVE